MYLEFLILFLTIIQTTVQINNKTFKKTQMDPWGKNYQ